jgi:hypothetical protein
MPPHVSSTCAHHQEVKVALHTLWYRHTYRCDDTRGCVMQFWPPDDRCDDTRGCVMQFWPPDDRCDDTRSRVMQFWPPDDRCDDTRGCVMQFWPPDDEHMCSKHVEEWNKLIVKQKFCASSWLITEINILRCTVSKTSKLPALFKVISRGTYTGSNH